FEAQSKGGAAGPAVVGPGSAPAHARDVARPVTEGRGFRGVQVGIDAAGQLRMAPVAAPLEDVAVHVVQPPGVGGIAADFGGPAKRGPRFGPVVRLPLEVRLFAVELIAKGSGRRRPGSAG